MDNETLFVGEYIIRSAPLSVPFTTGEELDTLTLYFVPEVVPAGIVTTIVPEFPLSVIDPRVVTPESHDPVGPDSCAL